MADKEHKSLATAAPEASQPVAGWARAVIMSAMLGIVLLATIPNMIGYPPSPSAEAHLPPLLGFVRGI